MNRKDESGAMGDGVKIFVRAQKKVLSSVPPFPSKPEDKGDSGPSAYAYTLHLPKKESGADRSIPVPTVDS